MRLVLAICGRRLSPRPFSPAHKPVDAGANQDYRKASTCERTRGSANLPKVIPIVSVVVPKVITVVGRGVVPAAVELGREALPTLSR
jgi:hypothetical protein